MSDKSKTHENLPQEVALKILRIFPDFGIESEPYLWDLNGICIGVEDVGGSEEFSQRFQRWADRWDECSDTDTQELNTTTLSAEKFDEQGFALAWELKRLVGEKSKVIYEFILKEGAVEVLADGSTLDWPPGVNLELNQKVILDEEIARNLA